MKKVFHNKNFELIRDASLKKRLLEDLEDHLDELRDAGKNTDNPWEILGDPCSLARQVNNIDQAWIKHFLFGVLSIFSSTILFYLSFLILSLPDTSIQQSSSGFTFELLGKIIAFASIEVFLFVLVVSVSRWYLSFFGLTLRGLALIRGIIYFPFIVIFFMGLEQIIFILMNSPSSGDIYVLLFNIFGLIFNFITIFFAQKIAFRYALRYQKWHKKLLTYLPYLLGVFLSTGIIGIAFEAFPEKFGLFATFPFLFTLVLYLLWGLSARILGYLLAGFNIAAIYGFVIVSAIILIITLAIFGRRFFKKRFSHLERFALAILIPIILIVPFKKQDVPNIEWNAPLIWSWENLEKKQLSFTYPWTATLMRSNDGMNVSYKTQAHDNFIEVSQEGGFSYSIKRDKIETIAFNNFAEIDTQNTKVPTDFTCEKRDTEQDEVDILTIEHPFGINCARIFYKDSEIASIDKGNIVNLELSSDGLLAIAINMGSYDPDYVYIVDINNKK